MRGFRLTVLLALWLPLAAYAADRFEMQAQEVAPNVYAVLSGSLDFPSEANQGWNSNLAFIVTDDGVLVFDTGSSEAIGEALRQQIRQVTDAPIRWIINSHAHGDHWMGTAALMEEAGTEVIATTTTRDLIAEGGQGWIDDFNRMTGGAIGSVRVVVPETTIDQDTERSFGGVRTVMLVAEHAHSPGDMALWLPDHQVLLAADAVYEGRLPGTFDADIPGWIDFLHRLEALGAEVVVPGHGNVGDGATLVRQRDFFETVWALAEAGFEAGQLDFEVAETARTEMAHFETYYPDLQEGVGAIVSRAYLQVEATLF